MKGYILLARAPCENGIAITFFRDRGHAEQAIALQSPALRPAYKIQECELQFDAAPSPTVFLLLAHSDNSDGYEVVSVFGAKKDAEAAREAYRNAPKEPGTELIDFKVEEFLLRNPEAYPFQHVADEGIKKHNANFDAELEAVYKQAIGDGVIGDGDIRAIAALYDLVKLEIENLRHDRQVFKRQRNALEIQLRKAEERRDAVQELTATEKARADALQEKINTFKAAYRMFVE